MLYVNQILQEIAETLRDLDFMDGIPVIVEEKGDPDNRTEIDIAQQSLCVVVGEREFEPTVQSADVADPNSVIGRGTIVVSLFEKPVINRADGDYRAIKGLSRRIGKALAYARSPGMSSPLFLRRISPVEVMRLEDDGESIITREVIFSTTAEL